MVPGIVLGSICALGFVLMLIWVLVRFCRRRQLAAPHEAQQFLTAGGGELSSAPGAAAALGYPPRGERVAPGTLCVPSRAPQRAPPCACAASLLASLC